MKLTKSVVDKLDPPTPVPPATKAQTFFRDDILTGFGVRVTSNGVKSFIVETRINGRTRRKSLGQYGRLTVEEARKKAKKFLGQVADGKDPIAEERRDKARKIKLSEVFEDYLKTRKTLKASTIHDYRRIMREAFADWQARPLASITKDRVAKRHMALGERSQARADNAMRVLRALFYFAQGQYEDENGQSLFPDNPVKRLSHTKAWYRIGRRKTVIKAHDLPAWYQAVISLQSDRITGKSETVRDYLLLLLFTGLRRTEGATLKWEQIDLRARTLTVIDTKNKEHHVLPLSNFLLDLLARRKADATSKYVFPGDGKTGYIVEPRRVLAKISGISGVSFTLHDLRRTFITVAESLDIPAYALKRLLNHKMSHDVTAGYIISDVDRLRMPMQKITDSLLGLVSASADGHAID